MLFVDVWAYVVGLNESDMVFLFQAAGIGIAVGYC